MAHITLFPDRPDGSKTIGEPMAVDAAEDHEVRPQFATRANKKVIRNAGAEIVDCVSMLFKEEMYID